MARPSNRRRFRPLSRYVHYSNFKWIYSKTVALQDETDLHPLVFLICYRGSSWRVSSCTSAEADEMTEFATVSLVHTLVVSIANA